jgi:hypothetical protein
LLSFNYLTASDCYFWFFFKWNKIIFLYSIHYFFLSSKTFSSSTSFLRFFNFLSPSLSYS